MHLGAGPGEDVRSAMKKLFEFNLMFMLPETTEKARGYLEAPYAAGCDDAPIGIAVPGRVGLAFSRGATGAGTAIKSAIRDVRKTIKGAQLVVAAPDLVTPSDCDLVRQVGSV